MIPNQYGTIISRYCCIWHRFTILGQIALVGWYVDYFSYQLVCEHSCMVQLLLGFES